MSNDPTLMDALNRTVRKADQAIRAGASGRQDHQAQVDTINQLVKVITQLDARIVMLEENLKSQS